jgi:1-acyl-sn-glycerol-3-phosphate acyltransferase
MEAVAEAWRAMRRVGGGLFEALAELGAARTARPRSTLEAAHRLAAAVGIVGRAHDVTVTVTGDVPRGVALIVANHVGYLDPVAILPVCPAIPVAAGAVATWPIAGPIASALRVAFVARADGMARVRTLRRVHALLASGVPVLNFPEGTATGGDGVQPFHRGTFGVAQRLGVPVVPVAIRYADPSLAWRDDATFVRHYLHLVRRPRVAIELAFGAPMPPRAGELAEDVAARARNAIVKALGDAARRQRVTSRELPIMFGSAGRPSAASAVAAVSTVSTV